MSHIDDHIIAQQARAANAGKHMRITLKFVDVNPAHVRLTLFVNGALAMDADSPICLRVAEVLPFMARVRPDFVSFQTDEIRAAMAEDCPELLPYFRPAPDAPFDGAYTVRYPNV